MDGLIAYILSKKYTNKIAQQIISAGFKVQVEQDRNILNGQGQEKILYLIPKISGSVSDGYDEFVYAQNKWEWIGKTDIDISGKENISSRVVNVDSNSDDNHYPTAKAVYDAIEYAINSIPNADAMNF